MMNGPSKKMRKMDIIKKYIMVFLGILTSINTNCRKMENNQNTVYLTHTNFDKKQKNIQPSKGLATKQVKMNFDDPWNSLKNTTWKVDNVLAGTTYTFFESETGKKKCIRQQHGSGRYIIGNEIFKLDLVQDGKLIFFYENKVKNTHLDARVPLTVFFDKKNKLHCYDSDRNFGANESLKMYSNKIKIGNYKGEINPNFIKSKYFDVKNINKYPTLLDEEKSKKADKEEIIEAVASFKDFLPYNVTEYLEDGGALFFHSLKYFIESPQEFYGKIFYVDTEIEIPKNDILRKVKIQFKVKRKYLVKTYNNKDGTITTYEAFLGAIFENGDIKEVN